MSQKYSLPVFFRQCKAKNSTEYEQIIGSGLADSLQDESFVKNNNMNDYKAEIQNLLRSPLGTAVQKETFNSEYYQPTIGLINQYQPNADAAYRMLAVATRVWTSEANKYIQNSSTVQQFVDYGLANPPGPAAKANLAQYRLPRSAKNAESWAANETLVDK